MLFDDREVLGLRGQDKMRIFVRIQALFKGALARKRVEQKYGFKIKTMGGHNFGVATPNYSNPKV